jgi:hypothetical protein
VKHHHMFKRARTSGIQPSKARHSRNRQRQPQRRDHYDWISLGTAVFGVVVVAATAGITAYQSYLTREALTLAATQQRGWLKLAPKFGSGLGIYPRGGAYIPFEVSGQNVGVVPIRYAWGVIEVHALPTLKDPRDLKIDLFKRCPKIERFSFGETIYPNDTIDLMMKVTHWPSRSEIDAMTDRDGNVNFAVVVCAQYETGTSVHPHRSFAIYHVMPKVIAKNTPSGFPASGGVVKQADIIVWRVPVGIEND